MKQNTKTADECRTKLTKEEYATLKDVFTRIGCDGLVLCQRVIDTEVSKPAITSFFENQPKVVETLVKTANECIEKEDYEAAWRINGFIKALPEINRIAMDFICGRGLLEEANVLCDEMYEARAMNG